ncbi:hypothetical protein ACF05L_22265 [Streptomyces bobili]|uniref:hypothetical protein n=1 Tax=Streptomyces bobili TaxID=67280 RepID=UPI0036F5B0AD
MPIHTPRFVLTSSLREELKIPALADRLPGRARRQGPALAAVPAPRTERPVRIGIRPHLHGPPGAGEPARIPPPRGKRHKVVPAACTATRSMILRLLTERHDDLVNERTRIINRLHALLRGLLPDGAPTRLSAEKAAALMRGIRPARARLLGP